MAAVEKVSRNIAGRIQTGKALMKGVVVGERTRLLEYLPVDKRPEYYNKLLEGVRIDSERASRGLMEGYDKIYKKGKILKLIEILRGRKIEKANQ